jgi:hypothetical protein
MLACGAETSREHPGRVEEPMIVTGCDVTDWSPIGVKWCSFDGIHKLTCSPIDVTTIAVAWFVDVTAKYQNSTVHLRFERVGGDANTVQFELITPGIDVSKICCNTPMAQDTCLFKFAWVAPCSYAPDDPKCLYMPVPCAPIDWQAYGYSSCHFDSDTSAHCYRASDTPTLTMNVIGTRAATGEKVTMTMREYAYDRAARVDVFTGNFAGFCNSPVDDPSCDVTVCRVTACSLEQRQSACIKPMMPRPATCCSESPYCCFDLPAVP